ncbi:hypothetical protein XENOCAPTIV_015586 [Xenoophorus captivus]|uniref:Dynein heavy chain hydrolytic ATP-binding dynein motor region domain-containing protein n=1 Tax=Xenoophorus captivus TaxID=1517983 RepID=A0ABV0R0K5_9TELE
MISYLYPICLKCRPCAMVIPDFELICEIMLVAEGFIDARLLARKFISLYTLCKELLSKQVLMRALRDFNLPKIVTSDVPIFLGLISDLFPQLDVPRKRDPALENAVRHSFFLLSGLFSSTMRELTSVNHDGPKWIVLDGDIDPMWIESLNTVMDDNKVLTLASNERISLSSSMRLLFEISHLRAATPATVSRAGILYVNPQDLVWSS